jgi:2-amino-4-hydroxy-6-hydroxymethyldihydropteridine diphosphokinase
MSRAQPSPSRTAAARTATVYVGLGSNLGEREAQLAKAAGRIAAIPGVELERTSWAYDTAPIGPAQPRYLNAVVELQTTLAPHALLSRLRSIEAEMGRASGERWGARNIDLDILLWGELVLADPELEIPHPRLHERAFALEPLLQLAPNARHPALGCSLRELLDTVSGQDVVRAGPFPAGW